MAGDVATREKLREFRLKDETMHAVVLPTASGSPPTPRTSWPWTAHGANVYRLSQADGWCDGIAFAANDTVLLVDSVRGGWSALDLYPTDAAAHFWAAGLRRLTATEGRARPFKRWRSGGET